MKIRLVILCMSFCSVLPCVAGSLLNNGSFENGLAGWQNGGASEDEVCVISLPSEGAPAAYAVRIDARWVAYGERSVLSKAFAVEPSSSYEVRGLVKRLSGYGYRSSVAVVWKDAAGKMIGIDNVWHGVLLGTNWVQQSRQVVSPAGAVKAQIKAGVEMGTGERNAALFTRLEFVAGSPVGPELAIHLFVGKPENESTKVTAHLTNTGDEFLSDLRVELQLPRGMAAKQSEWVVAQLNAGEVWQKAIELTGEPEGSTSEFQLAAFAKAGGKTVRFEKASRLNLADAQPVEVGTGQLRLPDLPEMKVKLGVYYFPVMIDWGGGGRPGLRAIESMEPLLGYYDERSPKTADWQIAWARQHGISWFAVDWYWNQGEEFLNEALDEGLMNSRFINDIEFCIHWCNQDPACTTFRAYDYSSQTLRELAATLCDRYFSRKNYLKVGGEPVFMIFQPISLINDNGGLDQAKAALEAMEQEVCSRGFKGIYFVAVNNSPVVPDYASAGFDCVAPYSFLYANLLPEKTDRVEFDYKRIVQRYVDYLEFNQKQVHAQELDYIPTAWSGWDDLPRYGEHRRAQSVVTVGNTPAAFRSMAQALPDYAEKENPLALIEAWNEWGEGTVIEPGKRYGFDYLSALLSALAVSPPIGKYNVQLPDQESWRQMQVGPLFINNVPYAERLNADRRWAKGLTMEFQDKRGLWLRTGSDEQYVWLADGFLYASLKGSGARLIGPEAIWLDAEKVSGLELRIKSTAATKFALQWRTEPDVPWRGVPVQSLPGGEWTEVRFECAGHPDWVGEIYQFRFVFKFDPGQVALDWVRTF